MRQRRSAPLVLAAILGVTCPSPLLVHVAGVAAQAPKILLDQPPRAIEYQLSRLTDDELTLVERKDDDPRYRPIYVALLTRKGVARSFRDEAVAALVKMDKSSPSRVLLDAVSRLPADDPLAAQKLLDLLFAQPAEALRQQRDVFVKAIDDSSSAPLTRRAAYGALLVADGTPEAAWTLALAHEGHLVELLRSIPLLPGGAAGSPLRTALFTTVAGVVATATDADVRAEALAALGWTRRDAATFDLLAQEVAKGTDASARAAAIRSLQVIPESVWPAAGLEPLARAIVKMVTDTPSDRRTEPAILDAIHLGEQLSAKLTGDAARTVRRDLRALGVQVVRIQTVFEQVSFDVKWFAVEAGKPVQLVLANPDAMPHNLVVGAPGALQEIGTAAGAMAMPADPAEKPFVPDSPRVLYSTRLLKEGESEALPFVAPKEPGEYVFLCTFPGHWVRMYGVMLVVPSLEAWEAAPTVPTDPMTKQPFASARNQ